MTETDRIKDTVWKRYQTLIWSLIALLAILYSLDGFPYPRPSYLFIIVGIIYILLFVQIFKSQQLSLMSIVSTLASLTVTSFFLRWSMWTRLVVGSGDYVAHIWGRTGIIVRNGEIISTGMYNRNPLVHILWAENIIVTDIWIFDVRFVALLVSSMFPVFIIYLSKQFMSLRMSLIAGILAGAFPLTLRTGALFETEALVIPLFVLQFALLISLLTGRRDIRYNILLVGLLLLLSFVQSLYPLIIVGVSFGVLLIENVRWRNILEFHNSRNVHAISLIGIGGPLLLIIYRIFSSDLGRARLARFIIGSSSLPSNFFQIFIPQSGAIGRSVSSSGGASNTIISPPIINWAPVVSLLLLGAVGGIYAVRRLRDRKGFQLLFVITIVTGVTTVFSLILFRSSTTMHIGYRNYYFIGIITLMFATLGTKVMSNFESKVEFLSAILLLVVFIYILIAPMSTIGNNQDPQFGGIQKGMTLSEKEQLNNIDRYLKGDNPIDPQEDLHYNYIRGPFIPRGDSSMGIRLHSRSFDCLSNHRTWSSNRYTVCIPNE